MLVGGNIIVTFFRLINNPLDHSIGYNNRNAIDISMVNWSVSAQSGLIIKIQNKLARFLVLVLLRYYQILVQYSHGLLNRSPV